MKAHMRTSAASGSLFKARNAIRSDVNKYKFLLAQDEFSSLEDNKVLHPNLIEGLQANNFTYLTNL